jgi:hypothetical protein
MKPQTIEPNTPLSVTMSAAEWQNVLSVLNKAPYDQVVGAIQAIVTQCMVAVDADRPAN